MKANNRSLLQHLSPTFLARSPSWVPLTDIYFITPDGTNGVTYFGWLVGFDPTTSWITIKCSPDWATDTIYGSEREFRNPDLSDMSRMLFLWAISPFGCPFRTRTWILWLKTRCAAITPQDNMVELMGLEPTSSSLQGKRSANWAITPLILSKTYLF